MMARLINEQDISCLAVDNDYAEVILHKDKYVLDYSTVMDLIINLVEVASQMEKNNSYQIIKNKNVSHCEHH